MNSKTKIIVTIVIISILLGGIPGLISGEGFFGRISKDVDVIGDFFSFLIKVALFIGVIWLLIQLFKGKRKD